jgi:hypothetical protein
MSKLKDFRCECSNCRDYKLVGGYCFRNQHIIYCDICKFSLSQDNLNKCYNCTAKICNTCLKKGKFKRCKKCKKPLCVRCYQKDNKGTCFCGETACDTQRGDTKCYYCNKKRRHITHTFYECIVSQKEMCCDCYGSIPRLQQELAVIKDLLNNKLCDPAKIVNDYWQDDFDKNHIMFAKNIGACNNLVNCAECGRTLCIVHDNDIEKGALGGSFVHGRCYEQYRWYLHSYANLVLPPRKS